MVKEKKESGKKAEKKTEPKIKEKKAEIPKRLLTVGKRKKAIARAAFRPGNGRVTINTIPLENISNEIVKMRIQEPVLIAGMPQGWDIIIDVKGGGIMGQADAVRLAIAKGLAQIVPDAKQAFISYDKNLLKADPRRTEPHKPPHSSWGPRRYKQRSKR